MPDVTPLLVYEYDVNSRIKTVRLLPKNRFATAGESLHVIMRICLMALLLSVPWFQGL